MGEQKQAGEEKRNGGESYEMETQGNGVAKTETNGGKRWARKGGSVEMEDGIVKNSRKQRWGQSWRHQTCGERFF